MRSWWDLQFSVVCGPRVGGAHSRRKSDAKFHLLRCGSWQTMCLQASWEKFAAMQDGR